MNVKIYADGAEKQSMLKLYQNPLIQGFTTNPTLMRKAGIGDYEQFALDILRSIPDRPISFEVFADEFDEMERQAERIAAWGPNVFVKIPVTNSRGESAAPLIQRLASRGVKQNVTAILTMDQIHDVVDAVCHGPAANVSVFAGRIADTGRDPLPTLKAALRIMAPYPNLELIWASPRELLNLVQASEIGCHIITVTADILGKLPLVGKDLEQYSLETVQMFRNDALASGFSIETRLAEPAPVLA
ncbi:MAG: transaldolase [Acidobacteria bacterium]|nr:transaldolase [Acidobacteriota bacterium]